MCPLLIVSTPTDVAKKFRPISLTPVLSKIAEGYARDLLLESIGDRLDIRQFGSIKGSSTVHALVEMYHHWVTGCKKTWKYCQNSFIGFPEGI